MDRNLVMEPISKTLHAYENEYKGKIKFNSWYQRQEVWSKTKKQKLIDSILCGYDIGIIYLREVDEDGYDFEVLDGQQRLRSIDQFIEGEFKTDSSLSADIDEIGYDDIEENNLYPDWIAFELQFQRIRSGSDRAVADFFLRLQEGMKLTTPEILNAIIGDMREVIVELSEYPIFGRLGVSDKRYRHRSLAAQAMKVEIDGDFDNRSFPSMKNAHLDRS